MRVVIDRTAFFGQRIDVGDRHPHFVRTVGQQFADGELVKIARVIVVERAPEQVAKIADIGPCFARGIVQARNLLFNTGAKRGLQAVIGHRLFGQAQQIGAVMPARAGVFF